MDDTVLRKKDKIWPELMKQTRPLPYFWKSTPTSKNLLAYYL